MIAFGLLIRPLPIEPSEIQKNKKKESKNEKSPKKDLNIIKPMINNQNGTCHVDNDLVSLPSRAINIEGFYK